MNAAVILIIGIVILALGYVFYGGWLSKQWGIDPSRSTPAHELEDGMDYCPAKAPVLMGHHFSSIAGAGPINGLLLAAQRHNLKPHLLDLRNSGDTAGDRERVVGYASIVFSEECDRAHH